MCWLCDEFGDPEFGGGIWFHNPKNQARNMYKLRLPGQGFQGVEGNIEGGIGGGATWLDIIDAMDKRVGPEELDRLKKSLQETAQVQQVLTLEESDKVLEFSSPIATMHCGCRLGTRALDERNELEYTCMGMGVGMFKWERWPERYKGGVKFVNLEEAIEWNHRMDKKGFVHIVMLFGTPYIGGFCQCDYIGCQALTYAVDLGVGTLKGHHVAEIDYDICNGCGICAQRCQFGALKFEVTSQKANIDQFKCFGCGLCETGCPREAIKLVERKSVPAVVEVWH